MTAVTNRVLGKALSQVQDLASALSAFDVQPQLESVMPNLLELMVARNNPRLAGILGGGGGAGASPLAAGVLGPGAAPEPPSLLNGGGVPVPQRTAQARPQVVPSPGPPPRPVESQREPGPGEKGLSTFARLFVGESIEGLTKREQEGLRRQSMITAGLYMLGADPDMNLGQALSMGVLLGRQAAQQSAGALLDEKAAQRKAAQYRRVFDNSDSDMTELEKWQEARRIAVKRGELDSVKVFNDVISELRQTEDGEASRKFKVVNGVPVFVDEAKGRVFDISGELIHEAPKAPANEKERLDRINQLADDFRTEASPLMEAQRIGSTATGAPATGAGDQTLVIALNKLLDPGSVVREGEFERVAKVGGFTAQAQQFANRIVSQGELSGEAREALKAEVGRLLQANAAELQSLGSFYERRSLDAGVDPRLVIRSAVTGSFGGSGNGGGAGGAAGAGSRPAPVLFPEDEGGQ